MNHQVKPKLLIIAPAWVGDMVMAQVLFILLRRQYANAQIDVVAPSYTFSLLEFMPEVNKAISLDLKHGEFGFYKRIKLALRLRKENYTQAIVLTNTWKSALLPFLANIPKRTGWLGELRFILLNDFRRLDKSRYPLMIERFAALGLPKGAALPPLPFPQFKLSQTKVSFSLESQALTKIDYPLLILCPGAEFGPAKRWPAEYYAQVAQQKLQQGWQIWLIGSSKEVEMGKVIQHYTDGGCINLIGKTYLSEAINLLSLADAVVCNDSGLMHIAAALNRATVVLYGASSPKFTPPLSKKTQSLSLNLSCSPCFQRTCPLGHLHCLTQLLPIQVLKAIDNLAAWRSPAGLNEPSCNGSQLI